MKKILVTGGLGFIGSHTVVELIDAGFFPVIIDNLENSQEFILDRLKQITGKEIPFYKKNVNDFEALNIIFSEHPDISGVIHFAAYKAVGESVQFPLKYYKNNIGGLVTLLEAMKNAGVKNLVFSSSCTVYGEPENNPVTENTPIQPATSPYGNTKQIGEEIINEEAAASKLNASILRYFNPIGAHDSGLIGELPLGIPNNLVPFITQTAAGIREKITVFGNDYPTPDGSCIRDYIHVCDLAIAHVTAVKRILEKKNTTPVEVFNLGTGKGSSVLDVVKTFEQVSGEKLNYSIGPRRDGDVVAVWAETTKANEVLGWKTERDLANSLQTAWVWQKNLSK